MHGPGIGVLNEADVGAGSVAELGDRHDHAAGGMPAAGGGVRAVGRTVGGVHGYGNGGAAERVFGDAAESFLGDRARSWEQGWAYTLRSARPHDKPQPACVQVPAGETETLLMQAATLLAATAVKDL
jgi:hypothetical protein